MPDMLAQPFRNPNPLLVITLRRSTGIAIGVSLLVHLLALIFLHLNPPPEGVDSGRPAIVARLREPAPPAPAAPVEAPVVAPVLPRARPPEPAPRHREPTRAPVIARRETTLRSAPSEPPPPPQQPVDNNPKTDMFADLARRQSARQQFDTALVNSTVGRELSEEEKRDARIKENLKYKPGVSGVFRIDSMGTREATFSFRGWTSTPRDSYLQTFTVDAGVGGNVELAVVRKMIELIRSHYKETNFNWDSARDGIRVLSSRREDNAELEKYLRREFFGQPR